MANPRPQLSLSELHQVRWLLGGLIGLVSAWTVFYLEVDALLALMLLTLGVPAFIWKPWLAKALPPLFHRLAFPLIVTVFAADLWANREPLPAMIRLSLMLLAYRCVSPRGRREDLQLILLALFLVVVTGVFTVSPAFVVQILFFTGASLGLLLAVTLSDSRSAGATTEVTGWERVRWGDLFRRLREVADVRVVGLFGLLFTGVVGCSILLFLALPRFELSNSLFLDRLITRKSRSGFSDDVRFNELVDITNDNSMAFAVDVSDPSAVPASLYWRMVVLDEYTGEGFRMSQGLRNSFSLSGDQAVVHAGQGRTPRNATTWTIYFQPTVGSRYLPLLGGFSRMVFVEAQSLTQSRDLRLAALQSQASKMLAYRVDGMEAESWLADASFAREKRQLPATQRRPRTQTDFERGLEPGAADEFSPEFIEDPTFLGLDSLKPTDRARLDGWVAEFGGSGEGGADFARRATAWLQGRHSYSMNYRIPSEGGEDVLVRWIGSTSPGHCELFAGGLVLLARAAGVPARMVTGFHGGVWNATSGNITVKNSDAHAWVEIWDEPSKAWMRSDPTSGSGATPPADQVESMGSTRLELDKGWGARMDSLRVFWYRRIVSFDQSSQVEILKGAKDKLRGGLEQLRGQLETGLRAAWAWVRQPWGISRVAILVLAGGGVVMLVLWWRRQGRTWLLSWRSRRAGTHRRDPVRREASLWLRKLARAKPGELQAAEREAARAELLRLRYGAREGWPAPGPVFSRAKRACRE
jgi:transglutaminase-like putative cysteine protease